MTNNRTSQEFPLQDTEAEPGVPEDTSPAEEAETGSPERPPAFWDGLAQIGWADPILRITTHLLSIVVVVGVIWAMRNYYLEARQSPAPAPEAALAAPLPAAEPTAIQLVLPDFTGQDSNPNSAVSRLALLHTTIPTRARVDVITYTVQAGDTLFGIADIYGLKPETILWGNFDVLQDNPHLLRPGQELNILPTDGTYHNWTEGENFTKVAEFYQVDPMAIVEYPGNRLDLASFDVSAPNLVAGYGLIIPGGKRALKDWGPPAISRTNPARASYYGPGHCGSVYEGAIGVGAFLWPTTSRRISGYNFSGIHPAIDIGGSMGNAIFATDAGVVVYAGWSNYGYGNLIVVDHGNGWQSAYAHLVSINVACGQSVFQGTVIGGLGSTGNSSGPHLHFEMIFGGAKVNPLNYLQ